MDKNKGPFNFVFFYYSCGGAKTKLCLLLLTWVHYCLLWSTLKSQTFYYLSLIFSKLKNNLCKMSSNYFTRL